MKFVWIEDLNGVSGPVNPDRVAYVRQNSAGETCLVFDGFAGGRHELAVKGTFQHVVAQLEGASFDPTAVLAAIRGPKPPKRRAPRAGPVLAHDPSIITAFHEDEAA